MNSILFLHDIAERDKCVDESFFTDIDVGYLFDRRIFECIAIESTTEEALARQDIFKDLLNGKLHSIFCNLRQELAELDVLYSAFDASKNKLEKIFRSRLVCNQYVKVCNVINKIESGNALLQNIISFSASAEKFTGIIEKYISDTQKSFDELKTIYIKRTCKIAKSKRNEVGLIEQLRLLAEELDIQIKPGFAASNMRLDDYTANSVCKVNSRSVEILSLSADKYINMLDRGILDFRKDVEFYLTVLNMADYAKKHFVSVTIPRFSDENIFLARDASDITLIKKGAEKIVPNDIFFSEDEKFFFVCGANGSGKTSYLKMIALNAFLGIFGCPVFSSDAEMCRFRKIFTHFPADDSNLNSGRFVEEKSRVDDILSELKSNDLVLFNETFSTTNAEKAVEKITETVDRVRKTGACGLFITHFGNLIALDIPMLTSEANTYKIRKITEKINSYAEYILKKYELSEEDLLNRFGEDENDS